MLRAVLLLHIVATLAFCPVALAQIKKPSLPPGLDPGGVAIALFTTGIDYTLPEVARRLARDGEGELIGLDLIDNDNRPFGESGVRTPAHWGGDGTALAVNLLDPTIGARLVPVRIDHRDPAAFARAVAFVARTPARVVVVPMWSPDREEWQPFRQAAEHFRQILFVVAAGDDGKDLDKDPVYPAAFGLPNMLVVTAASTIGLEPLTARVLNTANWGARTVDAVALGANSTLAAAAAAKAVAAMLAREPGPDGAALKQRLFQSSLFEREGETPQRTRTLSILVASVLKPTRGVPDPTGRILDKARVPERLQKPERRDLRPQDGKVR